MVAGWVYERMQIQVAESHRHPARDAKFPFV